MKLIIVLIILVFIYNYLLFKEINNFSNIDYENSILIIGNAPIKNKNLGKKINKFKSVIRFNDFNIKDFKNDIGSKIDYWVISDSFILFDYQRFLKKYNIYKNKKIFVIIPNVFKNNIKKLQKKLPKNIYNNLEILIEHKNIHHQYDFKNRWPSSGLLVILYCLQTFNKKIYIHGFNHFSNKENKIHYYEDKGKLDVSKQRGHIPNLEKNIVNNLKKNHKIFNLHTE